MNIHAIRSPFGLEILLPVVAFHTAAFVAGYKGTEATFPNAADLTGLARTISFETGCHHSHVVTTLLLMYNLVYNPCGIIVFLLRSVIFALKLLINA